MEIYKRNRNLWGENNVVPNLNGCYGYYTYKKDKKNNRKTVDRGDQRTRETLVGRVVASVGGK